MRAGVQATRATGFASTVGVLLGVRVFLASGEGLEGGTQLKRAGETAAAIANGKSAIAAGGGDEDGDLVAYGNVGHPPLSNGRRTCGSSSELSLRQPEK